MKYYLGIDGGGTKTTICIIDENENPIFFGTGGATSIDTVDANTTINNIKSLILEAKEELGFQPIFQALFAGIGGVQTDTHKITYQGFFQELPGVNSQTRIIVRNDMEIALASGKCYYEGLSLIAGTGMVAYGKDLHGNWHKSGGWGHTTLDLGSSFDMGFQAINAAIKAFDGRHKLTDFALEVSEKMGMISVYDILTIMPANYNNRHFIAEMAPIVTKHANLKNQYAMAICDNVASDLALAVRAVYNKLNLKSKSLVIVGSLGNSSGYFRNKLISNIKEIDKDFEIVAPLIDPSTAAAILGKKTCEGNSVNK